MLIWSVPYPVCLSRRWKWEEINIGLSHHLVAHRIEAQRLVEDFDYSLALCQTRFKLFIAAFPTFIVFSFLFLSSSPCCLCCCRAVRSVVTHQVWPVCDRSPSILPPHPCVAESITIQIITHVWTDSFYRVFRHNCQIFSPPSQRKTPRRATWIIFRCYRRSLEDWAKSLEKKKKISIMRINCR